MTAEVFESGVRDALSRAPDSAWIRRGLALFGWGVSMRIDAGTGADRFDRALRRLSATNAPRALASFTFDENQPGSVVIIPRILVEVDTDGTRFLVGGPDDLPPPASPTLLPDGHLGDGGLDVWMSVVDDALGAIREREVEKVVLSRRVQAKFESRVPTHLVLSGLARNEPGSHTFLVDGFVGSSPELLVSLASGSVRSISLAGSADPADPASAGFFDTEKMTLEHSLAADSVDTALTPFCTRLGRSERSVATYGDIQHLSTVFEGDVRAGTTVSDLLAALHPTAAVAGTPTKTAIELIRELEGHERGRYAGPVGWFDREGDGEFAIALRCGEIDGEAATLYTGAGIVEGSDAAMEFEETQIKLRPMLGALGIS
jgi:menaquinone-specific isochorismate synthase